MDQSYSAPLRLSAILMTAMAVTMVMVGKVGEASPRPARYSRTKRLEQGSDFGAPTDHSSGEAVVMIPRVFFGPSPV